MMDGQVASTNGGSSENEITGDAEEGEGAAGDSVRESDLEVAYIEGNMEEMKVHDDDLEQPDGQRSSLSLDDDGGTHFESHSQETVVRRGGPVRENIVSPTLQEGSDDNDVVFNPAQRLNFDDDDDDDEDEEEEDYDNDNEGEENTTSGSVNNSDAMSREYMQQRPVVHGSDMGEGEASGGALAAQDQGQNIRIIEGHDSSLLDDGGNSAFGFNFPQPQLNQMPIMSPVSNSNRLDDEAHNLYDSLEREDGSSAYGESHGPIMESNTSEYFSAASVSLMVANSHGQDNDSLWAQDEGADHGSYLSHTQQHFHSSHNLDRNLARHQSPPRNFQVDASNMFAPKRRSGEFLGEGNFGAYGDVQSGGEDNTDAQSIELSEEGLLHNTQMYAQPVSSSGSVTMGTVSGASAGRMDGGMPHQISPNEWPGNRLPANNSGAVDSMAMKPGVPGATATQPKNLAWNQGLPEDEAAGSGYAEGGGLDMLSDERQAGAGSSSETGQASVGDTGSGRQAKKPAGRKIQTRRPAVQGSASCGDNKRIGGMKGSSVPTRKAAAPPRPGNQSDANMRSNTASSSSKSSADAAKANTNNGSTVSAAGNTQSRRPQGQTSAAPSVPSRANSHSSLASNASSTNSRVGGVGKESHKILTGAAAARGASQLIVGTENNHTASMMQRQEAGREDQHSTNQNARVSQSNVGIHQGPHPHPSQSFDRLRPTAGQNQSEIHPSQSFTKQRPQSHLVHNQMGQGMGGDHVNESKRSADLPPRPHDSQHRRNAGGGSGSDNQPNQNHNQSQHHSSYQLPPYGLHHPSVQRNHAGFSLQPNYTQGASPSGSEGSPHSFNRDTVVTQMDSLKRQGQRLSPLEASQSNLHRNVLDNDIQGMEEVRSHLQNMLRMGAEASVTEHTGYDHSDTATDLLLSEQPVNRQLYFDTDSSSVAGNNPQDDVSEILENFPSFSSKIFSDISAVSGRMDMAAHGENQYLRDSLEKERYRRKHCEEHIQKQNAKLLEVQQQLAVAVSTDKRKDLMIEQLDKQLAKVVEGWRKREAEKDEFLKAMSNEKEQIEDTLQSQQTMINNFEQELAQTIEELRMEKEKSAETINCLHSELEDVKRGKEHMEEVLRTEREKYSVMSAEWDDLKDSRELAEKRAQQAQERLIQEQDSWQKREHELKAKITEVKEANQKVINMEKVKHEEQKKKREDAEAQNDELKTDLKKAVLDMEQLIREKESQKVEMAIMEAKAESAQRKLEADLHAQMEKEIADQATEFHTKIETALEEAAERHRKQVAELHSRHQRDMERQSAAMNEERQRKEDDYRKQINELEEKLQDMRSENTALKQSKVKLESQRMEILTKLQFMMQSQWNEAVSLLVSTPQKKSLNSSFLSSQSGNQLASAMAVTDGNTSVTSLNLVSSSHGPSGSRTHGSEGQGRGSSASSPRPASATAAAAPAVENGRDERHDEVDRMDRVEEYLQRLSHHVDIPMTRNDLQVSEMNQGGRPMPVTVSVSNNNASYNCSISVLHPHQQQQQQQQHQHQQQQQQLSSSDHGSTEGSAVGSDYNKPSNNLSNSHQTHVHGYVTGQSGKTLITSMGHMTDPELRYQAVAMRSPQQSSSRISSDPTYTRAKNGTDQHPPTASQPFIFGSHPSHGAAGPPHQRQHHSSPHHPHPHHRHQQQQQELQYSPQQQDQPLRQPHAGHAKNYSNSAVRTLTGDYGDHKDVKLMTGAAANINLYSPDSPTFSSSPNDTGLDHWSPSRVSATQMYSGASIPTTTASPPRGAANRAPLGLESPVKRYRPRPGQAAARNADRLNESLSPPVKQSAERDVGDSMSEASSGYHDANRLQANYSHLSDRMEEHQSRQGELQHYVKMLLQKAPGSVCSEPERDIHSDHEVLESSRDLTENVQSLGRAEHTGVDLDLNDTATAAELTSQLARLQHLRELQTSRPAQARNPSSHPAPKSVQSSESIAGHLTEFMGDNGVISAEGLTEISHLLTLYRDQWETNPEMAGQANVASQLMDALKTMSSGLSPDHVSRKEEKKPPGVKHSPKSQQTRKVRDLASKNRKVRSASQSADTSLATHPDSLDKSTNNRSGSQGPAKRAPTQQAEAGGKDKKAGSGKPAGSKGGGGGGPVWK